jgi:hypothetical protein
LEIFKVTELELALKISNMWLDGRMNSLTQMVPGDPDCDACVVARQLVRTTEAVVALKAEIKKIGYDIQAYANVTLSEENDRLIDENRKLKAHSQKDLCS